MAATFQGTYISGRGDADYLRLIEESFAMLRSSPELPTLKMLYKSETDHLSEGFIWGSGWWIQNSYGFTLGAVPLLDELWFSKLQNSYDAFWNRMGDGKRVGEDNGTPSRSLLGLVGPDGALGDCVFPNGIAYKQGDGDFSRYDWFYEATAAGVNMEADILLFDRREEQLRKYLPKMQRSLDHIERTRDESGLLLVGTSANLLAPSYGGSYDEKTGTVGKGYLTGLVITYSAALGKTAELYRMVGDEEHEAECRARLGKNLEALPKLLTEEGYFVKSMDPDGTKHGIYGADRYGYLEGVCNVDAIALDVADEALAGSIYRKIASVEGIRPAGVLCTNYPHLDDTLPSYLNHTTAEHSLGWKSGDWVDGGCWCTVEGRAVLAYMRLGRYADAYRACRYYMDWAEEYRQDAPLSQWGFNTNNPWQKESDDHTVCERPVGIMIDNFASASCLLRGLFGYTAKADGLHLRVRVPDSIEEYAQSTPIRCGGCRLYLSYRKSDGLTAEIDGETLACADGEIFIPAEKLIPGTDVSVTVNGAEPTRPMAEPVYPAEAPEGLEAELVPVYSDCVKRLEGVDGLSAAMLRAVLEACIESAQRDALPFDRHVLRPMTEDKIAVIKNAYRKTAAELYQGYLKYIAD